MTRGFRLVAFGRNLVTSVQDPGLSLLRSLQWLDTFVWTEVTRFTQICLDFPTGLWTFAKFVRTTGEASKIRPKITKNHQKNRQLEIRLIPELLSRVDMKQIEFLNYKNMN